MTRHKIAILVGSLRDASINRKIARSICAMEKERLDCNIVEIGDLPLYNQEYDGAPDEPASYKRFRDEIAAADGILFVSPEYNRGMPGVLKNAIDVGSRPYGKSVWNRKPAAIVTASPGAIGGFGSNHQIRQSGVFLNMPVMQHPEAYLGHIGDDKFDENGMIAEGKTRDFVKQIAEAFADWVTLIEKSKGLIEPK
jgi:chromate reductase